MRSKQFFTTRMQKAGIPEYMIEGAAEYLANHRPAGAFLEFVFSGNFPAAARCADAENQKAFYAWALFVFESVPGDRCGSPAKYKAWIGAGDDDEEEGP